MSAYTVEAVKWEHGWELHVQDVGVTQCRTLATAAQQVRDFMATIGDIATPMTPRSSCPWPLGVWSGT